MLDEATLQDIEQNDELGLSSASPELAGRRRPAQKLAELLAEPAPQSVPRWAASSRAALRFGASSDVWGGVGRARGTARERCRLEVLEWRRTTRAQVRHRSAS